MNNIFTKLTSETKSKTLGVGWKFESWKLKDYMGIEWTTTKLNRCQNMDADDWVALMTEMSNELEQEKQFFLQYMKC